MAFYRCVILCSVSALAIENPPDTGEYRVFNQFEECYTIEELAYIVQRVAADSGIEVTIYRYDNPRAEKRSALL